MCTVSIDQQTSVQDRLPFLAVMVMSTPKISQIFLRRYKDYLVWLSELGGTGRRGFS